MDVTQNSGRETPAPLDLTVSLAGKTLANPVGAASGTFGFGEEYAGLTDLSRLGALYTKAVTPAPRAGNRPPRLAETPAGLINSIGLANPGLSAFLTEKKAYLAGLKPAVIVNVAGSTEDDYLQVLEALEDSDPKEEVFWGWEINISCPNVKQGGLAFGTDPRQVENLTRRLRPLTRRPLIMKLTPNVTDITRIARAAEAGGADALSCINTVRGMMIDPETRRPSIPAKTGGLSGPAILPVGLAAVYQVSRAVSLPVIGLGGISSGADAVRYLLAGAAAVQAGTGIFTNPQLPGEILSYIRDYAQKQGIKELRDFPASLRD